MGCPILLRIPACVKVSKNSVNQSETASINTYTSVKGFIVFFSKILIVTHFHFQSPYGIFVFFLVIQQTDFHKKKGDHIGVLENGYVSVQNIT